VHPKQVTLSRSHALLQPNRAGSSFFNPDFKVAILLSRSNKWKYAGVGKGLDCMNSFFLCILVLKQVKQCGEAVQALVLFTHLPFTKTNSNSGICTSRSFCVQQVAARPTSTGSWNESTNNLHTTKLHKRRRVCVRQTAA
jgi:hypothetical protein